MKKIILICFILTLYYTSLIADDFKSESSKPYRIGLLLGYNFNHHSTDIPILWDAQNCGWFTSGTSFGYNIGLNFNYEILPKFIYFDLGLVYGSLPANFELTTSNYRVFNPGAGQYEDLKILYNFTADLGYLLFKPGILIQPLKQIPLKIRAGLDIGNPLVKSSYSTSEEIISPKVFVFPDETQKHITQTGNLTDAGTSLSGVAGLVYEHNLSENFIITGEFYYQHPFNSRLSNNLWKVQQFGLNAMVSYAFRMPEKKMKLPEPPSPEPVIIIEQPPEPVIVKVEPKKLDLEIIPNPVQVLETTVTQTYPILPYIFFDKSSDELNKKYINKFDEKFDEKAISSNTLEIYYNLLNIIGKRLSDNKNTKIIILGLTDGSEISDINERKKLAQKRAEAVSEYLQKNWKIESNRLKIQTKDLPDLPTSTLYQEGFEENRRVEIYSDNPEILKPVIVPKFKEYQMLSQDLTFLVRTTELDSVRNWNLQIGNGKNEQSLMGETLQQNILKLNISENLKNEFVTQFEKSETLKAKFSYLGYGINESKEVEIPIEKQENTYELQRLNLIVFDFDKYEINATNKKLITTFVANSIQDASNIRIIGSTDRLGTPEYNLNLSKQRAEASYEFLSKIKPKANFLEVNGIGDSKLPFDNNLPEGRFYSRTVMIEVKTPLTNHK